MHPSAVVGEVRISVRKRFKMEKVEITERLRIVKKTILPRFTCAVHFKTASVGTDPTPFEAVETAGFQRQCLEPATEVPRQQNVAV
jgi:hypothetical protein